MVAYLGCLGLRRVLITKCCLENAIHCMLHVEGICPSKLRPVLESTDCGTKSGPSGNIVGIEVVGHLLLEFLGSNTEPFEIL